MLLYPKISWLPIGDYDTLWPYQGWLFYLFLIWIYFSFNKSLYSHQWHSILYKACGIYYYQLSLIKQFVAFSYIIMLFRSFMHVHVFGFVYCLKKKTCLIPYCTCPSAMTCSVAVLWQQMQLWFHCEIGQYFVTRSIVNWCYLTSFALIFYIKHPDIMKW